MSACCSVVRLLSLRLPLPRPPVSPARPPPLRCQVAYCTGKNSYLDGRRPQFEVPYDILIVAVGEQPATFGTPGVEENCYFMKEVGPCSAAALFEGKERGNTVQRPLTMACTAQLVALPRPAQAALPLSLPAALPADQRQR